MEDHSFKIVDKGMDYIVSIGLIGVLGIILACILLALIGWIIVEFIRKNSIFYKTAFYTWICARVLRAKPKTIIEIKEVLEYEPKE